MAALLHFPKYTTLNFLWQLYIGNTLHFVLVELDLKEGKERNLLIVEFETDTASFVRKEQTANLLEVGSLQVIFQVTN